MKTINPISVTTLFYLSFSITAISQTATKTGGLLAYGTQIKNIGIGTLTQFPIIDKLTTSPSLKYDISKDKSSRKPTWIELDGYANFYLLEKNKKSFNTHEGLNHSNDNIDYEVDYGFLSDISAGDGRLGDNLGGSSFNFDGSLTSITEIKYVLIEEGLLVTTTSVKFNIKKNETFN